MYLNLIKIKKLLTPTHRYTHIQTLDKWGKIEEKGQMLGKKIFIKKQAAPPFSKYISLYIYSIYIYFI